MKTKHLILTLLALLMCRFTYAQYSWYVDGTTWFFEINGNNAELCQDCDAEDCYTCFEYYGSRPFHLTIPSRVYNNNQEYSVTSIGGNAFAESDLSSITIPNSITYIGGSAFYRCYNLTSITIPNSVTSIDWSAFQGCYNLASISIPNSVTSIGRYAFDGCSSLTSVTVDWTTPITIFSDVFSNRANATLYVPYGSKAAYEAASYWNEFKEIVGIVPPSPAIDFADDAVKALCVENWDINGDGELSEVEASYVTDLGTVFKENTEITSFNELQYFTGLSEISKVAFYFCTNLTSVSIPNSVTSIGSYAFGYCTGLTSLTIPSSVTSFGESAFGGCTGLTSFTIPNSVTSIGSYAFDNCTGLTSVTIPSSVTSFGSYAFFQCEGLTSAIISEGVTSIAYGAFDECENLTSVTIPSSVTSIGDFAFYECSSLTSVTFPNSVTSIGNYAFKGCSNLTDVRVDITTPLSIGSSTFSNGANATLYVPVDCKAAYEAATYWNDFKEIVEVAPVVNVGSTGFATYCSPVASDFSCVLNIKAYIASGFNPSTGTLVLTRVTEVPADEGLYIIGDEGSYNVPATTTDMVYSNLLKGVTTATTISPTDGDYTNFILANGSHGIGFYTLSSAGELAGGKAYLQLPTASVASVKAISFVFNDGDETGISNVKDVPSIEGIYNLQGQRISQPRKGLNIINGKKVIIK